MNELKDRLLELRKENKYNQQYIATFLSVSRSSYSGYETGNYEPGIDSLKKLAELYNVTIDYLLGKIDLKLSAKELEFTENLELSNTELLKKYNLTVDGVELSEVEIATLINVIRSFKKEYEGKVD